jgi:hypothetical protein
LISIIINKMESWIVCCEMLAVLVDAPLFFIPRFY